MVSLGSPQADRGMCWGFTAHFDFSWFKAYYSQSYHDLSNALRSVYYQVKPEDKSLFFLGSPRYQLFQVSLDNTLIVTRYEDRHIVGCSRP